MCGRVYTTYLHMHPCIYYCHACVCMDAFVCARMWAKVQVGTSCSATICAQAGNRPPHTHTRSLPCRHIALFWFVFTWIFTGKSPHGVSVILLYILYIIRKLKFKKKINKGNASLLLCNRISFDVIWFMIVSQIKMPSKDTENKKRQTRCQKKTTLIKKNDHSQEWQHKKQTILNKYTLLTFFPQALETKLACL